MKKRVLDTVEVCEDLVERFHRRALELIMLTAQIRDRGDLKKEEAFLEKLELFATNIALASEKIKEEIDSLAKWMVIEQE